MRARVHDEGDGTYSVDYKVTASGKYRLSVMRGGAHLPGRRVPPDSNRRPVRVDCLSTKGRQVLIGC